ncbi:leucine-rich_repeat domain-containing protein [Hexamita inflata]|uniref:Leucine-rich repeat domain-containing protein n=1 Tax=Hexamita inflata TaxID=28002 RepID=A0AA86NIK1_9EUKA|nr:leucine-rich repeat domain-containing protein [Hexamita inflata]
MVQLVMLNLSYCSLNSVDPLKHLVNLKELDLSYNENINIHNLQFMKQLTKLSIHTCSLIDITYLKSLVNLEELDIQNNKIVYLEPLKDLQQIIVLYAGWNQILDVQTIRNRPNFSSYDLDYQRDEIPDAKEISFANRLRDINAQIDSLRNMRIFRSNLKSNMTLQRIKIGNYTPILQFNFTQCTGQQ